MEVLFLHECRMLIHLHNEEVYQVSKKLSAEELYNEADKKFWKAFEEANRFLTEIAI